MKKFKVWCKDYNEWEKHECFIDQSGMIYHRGINEKAQAISPENHISVFYIDRKDKNDVEIYEGCIVKFKIWHIHKNELIEKQGIVKMKNGICGIFYDNQLMSFDMLSFNSVEDYEIIGDIYENPELMEN